LQTLNRGGSITQASNATGTVELFS